MRLHVFRLVFVFLCVVFAGAAAAAQSNPVPLIYPLVPSATAPGGPAFTLTVNGTGFVSGATVNWNGSARTTTFVNSSQLTAAITAADITNSGTAIVTATNPGPGGGRSNSEDFQVTNALTATNFTVFSNNEIDGYRNRTSNTLAGDFNGDGKLDLVAYSNGFIYFLPGNGDGTFGNWTASVGPPPSTNSNDFSTYLATADLNGDGIPDLVLMNYNGTFVALGNGNGTFRLLSASLSDVVHYGSIVIADFNGDGFLDLAYTTTPFTVPPVPTAMQVQLGNGDGTFRTGPATVFPLSNPSGPTQFLLGTWAAGDLNGDGKLDLLVTAVNPSGCQGGTHFLLEYPGNGDGSFGTPSTVPGTIQCGSNGFPSAEIADFNGDGKLDVAYFQQAGTFGVIGYLTIDLGNGDGTFQAPYQYSESPTQNLLTGPLVVGDFNGDGKLDLMVGTQLLYGNGDGSFTPYGPIVSGLQVVQAGDFNGDGKLDLLALGTNPNNSSQVDLRLLTQIPAPADFSGAITPTQTAVPGGSANYAGSVTALNGFTGDVALSASGMPTGVTASFNPATVTGGSGSYTMTVTVASSVPLGTYGITVTGTSGSLRHSTMVNLIVNSSTGDFSGSLASDAYQNIIAGQNATYTIQVSPISGYNGDVTLSVSGLPSGTTASFNPSTVHGASGTSTLTVSTTSSTPQNCNPVTPTLSACALTITATSGPLSHSGNVFLGIRTSPGDFTGTVTPNSQTISVGQSATYTANITYTNGFSTSGVCLNLAVSGLPPGAQLGQIFPGGGCMTGETDTFTISAPPGTPTGTYTLLITGFGRGRVRAGTATLTIN